jgi:hypothetical protein
MKQQQQKNMAPLVLRTHSAVPIRHTPLNGYVRVGNGRSRVIWQQQTAGQQGSKKVLRRFHYYEYESAAALLKKQTVAKALERQLAKCISTLQDEEVTMEQHTSLQQAVSSGSTAADAATAAAAAVPDWLSGVQRRQVPEGHRAYSHAAAMAGQQQMEAIYACEPFSAGGFIGMYLGNVYGTKEVAALRMFQSAADLAYYVYQVDFEVTAPGGTIRQMQQDDSSSSSTSNSSLPEVK